jgi:molybdenum cofactor biosynthesis enzyme MoaA
MRFALRTRRLCVQPKRAPGSGRRSTWRPADGKLRYCLFAIEEDDVKTLMRSGAGDEEIATLVRRNVAGKWAGHEINSAKFVAPPRPMYSIGG